MGKVYRITTLGFEEKELAALKRILILSLKRDRAYKISENGSGRPDLILVNADVEAALAKVDRCVKDKDLVVYATRNPAGHEFPNILKLDKLYQQNQKLHNKKYRKHINKFKCIFITNKLIVNQITSYIQCK